MYVPDESGSVQSPITLKEIYDRFVESTYYASLSKSAQGSHKTAWMHLTSISNIPVSSITKD